MSSEYRENAKTRKTLYQNTSYNTKEFCPGSCTCDYGTRTEYDYMQYQNFILGKKSYLPIVKEVSNWK